MQPVVYADVGHDVEVIVRLVLVPDDFGVRLQNSVSGQNSNVRDGVIGGTARNLLQNICDDATNHKNSDQHRNQVAATFGLREASFVHRNQNNSEKWL